MKKLQYELESFKQEREVTNLRHEKELRDVQLKAEEDFRKAQVRESITASGFGLIVVHQASESSQHVSTRKYEALSKELKEIQDQAINQRQDLEKKLRALQEQNRSLRDEVEEGQTELSSTDRQHKHQLQEIESKHATLQKTLNDLRTDLENQSSTLQATQGKLAQKESEVGGLESEVLRLKAQTGDADTLAVIKRELSDQVTHIRKLESSNREQNAELKHFRRIHKAVEVVEEEKRVLHNKLSVLEDVQKQLREAQLQRQILEDERQSWTSYLQSQTENGTLEFSSPEDLARALVRERTETATLALEMGKVRSETLEKDGLISSLSDERSRISADLEKLKASGSSGSDNRAKARLERQKALAVKEVELLREQIKTFDSEEITYHSSSSHPFDEQKQKRIQDLEALVDQYRAELQSLNETLSQHEDQTQKAPLNPLKRAHEDDNSSHLGELTSRKNRKLQDDLSILEKAHTLLKSEHQAAKTQLSHLQHSLQTRVLALRSNPTADAEAIKMSTLSSLREENKALLAQLESPDHLPATHAVPISSLESMRRELEEQKQIVADKEKRMMRLKQIWSLKSLELREAVASLLGYQMDFVANGKFRLTSIFNPPLDEEDGGGVGGGNSLIFDGETGTMKISGGDESPFAREIRPLIEFWVEERGEIPGLLAAYTLEAWDKSTRAAKALG